MYKKQKKLSEYSNIKASLRENTLMVSYERARTSSEDLVEIDISAAPINTLRSTAVKLKSRAMRHKVLLVEKVPQSEETLVVYTDEFEVLYYRHKQQDVHPLTRLMIVKSRAFFVRINKRGMRLIYTLGIENKYGLPVKAAYLTVGEDVKIKKNYPVYKYLPSKLKMIIGGTFHDHIPISSLLGDEPSINEPIRVSLDMGGEIAHHSLSRGSKYIKSSKWFYAPLVQTRANGYSLSIRRGAWGGLVLVRRQLEDVENRMSFRILESKIVSFMIYHTAHIVRKISKKKVNIFFEKNANQAEEGAIDIFRVIRRQPGNTKNYFIINSMSSVYSLIHREPGIVKNYTLKSYWVIYRANNVIATEVPQHANILRSGNKYVRRAPYSQNFVFLQHGITYLKAQEKNSSFVKGREGEPDYMVVGSNKERDVVADMLGIEEERILNVGLPIFDKIKYGHIKQSSDDIVTIMLTWKPYEEHLKDFSKSSYYKTIMELYDTLEPLIGGDRLRIVAHPKFTKLLSSTDITSVIWKGKVEDALRETKLLITDYSSVCYNVFYQGGGVIFYQPDLEVYEENNGKLIPSKDEYIGYRAFTNKDVKTFLNKVIKGRKIELSKIRTSHHEKIYATINEHRDGKNIDRLIAKLHKLNII